MDNWGRPLVASGQLAKRIPMAKGFQFMVTMTGIPSAKRHKLLSQKSPLS